MHTYRVFLRDDTTDDLYELFPKSYQFTDELNKESRATLILSYEILKETADYYGEDLLDLLSSKLMELYIERDGTKIFYGVLSKMEIVPLKDGSRSITLEAVSWIGLFTKRIVGVPKTVYSSTDAGQIAWDLINDSQTSDAPYSDWGITMGSITASVNRDRTYRFDRIYDQIVALSNANLDNGFDFEIDTLKQFNVYYPQKGQNRPNVVFNESNIYNYRWKKPLVLELTNKVHVQGAGFNDEVLYVTRTADAAYRSPFGTLEDRLNEKTIETTGNLASKGDRKLAEEQAPIIEFDITHEDDAIQWSDYLLGDNVKVNMPFLDMANVYKRVVKRKFDMDEGRPLIQIELK
jgi:hypothetical protein